MLVRQCSVFDAFFMILGASVSLLLRCWLVQIPFHLFSSTSSSSSPYCFSDAECCVRADFMPLHSLLQSLLAITVGLHSEPAFPVFCNAPVDSVSPSVPFNGVALFNRSSLNGFLSAHLHLCGGPAFPDKCMEWRRRVLILPRAAPVFTRVLMALGKHRCLPGAHWCLPGVYRGRICRFFL